MSRPITADAIEAPTHGWTAASARSDMERLVRAARRHSRVVRVVRVMLPIAVVLGLGTLVFVTYFDPMRMLDSLPAVSGKLAVQGSKITMEAPRIAGFTRDSRSYEMTAETAVQDIRSPDVVDLKNLRATVELPGPNLFQLTAASGVYNTKSEQLIMRDRVNFTTAHGYRGKLREASVDVKKGNIVSDQPVEIILPDGLLKANRLEIEDSGDVIRFDKGVVLTLDAKPEPAKPEAPRPVAEGPKK